MANTVIDSSASYQTVMPLKLQAIGTFLGSINKTLTNQSLPSTGFFTMTSTASYVVSDTNVLPSSKIFLTPVNNTAATLQGSAKCLYPVANANFMTVFTASGASAAGTEKYQYLLINS